jgi:glycosyl transferase family 25
MKAYVINLPRSTSRRSSMAEQLQQVGLEHEFIEAVDGRTLTPSQRAGAVDESAVARFPHWLTPGTIGCALSHLRAFERILESNRDDVALILEDDVILPPTIPDTVARIVPHMDGSEVVLLYFRNFGVCRFSARDAVELDAGARLAYPLDARKPLTTAAYLITPEACRRLAEVVLPVRVAADTWGHFYELGAIESVRCVIPRPVSVRKDFKSTIDYVGPRSMRLRTTTFVARHRLPLFFQLLTLNRHLVERRMSKTLVVPDPSPIALGRRAVAG